MAVVPIEERIAIQELTNLYALYCDTHQLEKMFALFTDDCIADESVVGGERVTSNVNLRRIFHEAGSKLGPMMHICTNHTISDYAENSASGTCHVLAEGLFYIDGRQNPFRIFGYYDDRYVKNADRWYFKSRVLKLLVPSHGAPTIGGITYDTASAIGTR